MKEINDNKSLDKLISEKDIIMHLKNQGIEFKLLEYEKGEMIIKMSEITKLFQFVVKGTVEIYGVRKDGTIYPVRHVDEFTVLGDVEICNSECVSQFFVEAKTNVICIAIPLNENRELLLNDNFFLRYLLKSLSMKMLAISYIDSKYNTLGEKLIHYMKEECEDNMITSIENTRFQLKCSRRHLQRTLRKFVEEGKIEKVGKGCYKLGKMEEGRGKR